jgi:hypothetical protein
MDVEWLVQSKGRFVLVYQYHRYHATVSSARRGVYMYLFVSTLNIPCLKLSLRHFVTEKMAV